MSTDPRESSSPWIAVRRAAPSTSRWSVLCVLAAGVFPAPAQSQPRGGEQEVRIVHTPSAPAFAGTLAIPNGPGPHPAALLVSPAGEHARDELRRGGRHLADLAARLAEHGVASLRVDNRGIGGSAPVSGTTSMQEMARDALGIMDHLGWDTAHVAGVSMGGMISQELALIARDRLRSLSLIATHPGNVLNALPPLEGLRRFARVHLGAKRHRHRNLARLLFTDEHIDQVGEARLIERLADEEVPVGPVLGLDELGSDPQIVHNEAILEFDHPTAGRFRQARPAARFAKTPQDPHRRLPPLHGEHSDEILRELGYTDGDIERLRKEGVA